MLLLPRHPASLPPPPQLSLSPSDARFCFTSEPGTVFTAVKFFRLGLKAVFFLFIN